MSRAGAVPAPVVTTVKVADPGPLVDLLPSTTAMAWLSGGDGLVGWGEAARAEFHGPDRLTDAASWWRAYVAGLQVDDEVDAPGSGPVAFGSFGFADDPGRSVLVVPRRLFGRRGGVCWMTTVGETTDDPAREPVRRPESLVHPSRTEATAALRDAVAETVDRIHAGRLQKAVLADAMDVRSAVALDSRWLVARLAESYPDCWTFAVDGLVGATPELLARRDGEWVSSRVLAGTTGRGGDPDDDDRLGVALLASAKDQDEHRFAADSVVSALSAYARDVERSPAPYVLRLANVQHLATDVTGRLAETSSGRASSLDVAAALHPTAAVAGTPTGDALRVIGELERVDRGRYAGPVGWIDGRGDGEWCIALRCAEIEGTRARIFAGCGIVADSDPVAEAEEWWAKTSAVRHALGGPGS